MAGITATHLQQPTATLSLFMKTHRIFPAILFLFCLPGSGMESVNVPLVQAAAADSPIIQVQVEYVEMSHEDMTKLLFLAEPKSIDATPLRKQVQEMVARKEAKVIETLLVAGRGGQKASSESVAERIYPTEYEPPETGPIVGATSLTPATSSSTPQGVLSALTPTAFDTRNCGSSLEVESTLSPDGGSVIVHLRPELVWHTGNTTWLEVKDSLGNPSKAEMPNFSTLRLQTILSCPSGRYVMAAALSPKDEKGIPDMSRKVLVFVKCEVLAAK